jgi:hypothetical protein
MTVQSQAYDDYKLFLSKKEKLTTPSGIRVNLEDLNQALFPFQQFCTQKALLFGSYALFEECGLGKTLQQVEWAYQVSKFAKGPVLILCPLAVAQQTIAQAKQYLGYDVIDYFSQSAYEWSTLHTDGIFITNYDQIDNVDFSKFKGVVLDESSILKNFNGATKKKLIEYCAHILYKLCCTATPSPNDDTEITNHSEFLAYGRREEILAMYFTHDGGNTSEWVLKGHAKRKFWQWVKTWSLFVSNPRDIGFDGSQYVLPELNVFDIIVKVPVKQGLLFNHLPVNATNYNQELRETKEQRLSEVLKIISQRKNESFIVWVKHNEEADWLSDYFNNPDSDCHSDAFDQNFAEVRGSHSIDYKERTLKAFADGKIRILLTKTKIAGIGMNFQNCHNQIFASPDFSFEQMYQAIRRVYRFGQQNAVNVWMIIADTMGNVRATIKRKEEQYQNLIQYLIAA